MPFGPEEIDLPVKVTDKSLTGSKYADLDVEKKGKMFRDLSEKVLHKADANATVSDDPFEQFKQLVINNGWTTEQVTQMAEETLQGLFWISSADATGTVFFGNDEIGYYEIGLRTVNPSAKSVEYVFDTTFVNDFLVPLEKEFTELSTIEELANLKVSIKATMQQRDILEDGINWQKLQDTLRDDIQTVYPALITEYEQAATADARAGIQSRIDALLKKDAYLISFLYADHNSYAVFIDGREYDKQFSDIRLAEVPVLPGTTIQTNGAGNNEVVATTGAGNNEVVATTGAGNNEVVATTGAGNNEVVATTGAGNNEVVATTGAGNNEVVATTGAGNNEVVATTGAGNNEVVATTGAGNNEVVATTGTGNNEELIQKDLSTIKETTYTSRDQLRRDCDCLPGTEKMSAEQMSRIDSFVDGLATSGLSGQEAMDALRMLCKTDAQWTYYQKYLQIKQQFNANEISKADAVRKMIKMEDKDVNHKEVTTGRGARRLAVQAGRSRKEQLSINKNLRKALICDLQAEALEAQNKWMLDMMACAESRNIGTNPLPNPSFVQRCPDMISILNDPSSSFRTSCRTTGYTYFDDLGRPCSCDDLKELMDGLDLGSDWPGCPALCSQTYPIWLAARTPDNANGTGRVEYGPNGEVMPVRDTFDNTMLIGEFARFVKAKEENKVDYYDNGWKPLFQEVALRHLTSHNKFDFYQQMAGVGRPREKLDRLLEETIYSLVDDAVVSDMRQRYKGYDEMFKDSVAKQHKVLGGVFLDSLINQHLGGVTVSRSDMQAKLLDIRGGRRTSYQQEPSGNEAVGERIFNHVKNLPNHGGETWLNKKLELSDYAFLPNGAWGGAERMIDMGIRNSLISFGVSPQHASEVGAAIKMGGMVVLALGARKVLKSVYKGEDGSGGWRGLGRLAMLGTGLYILPRALFNRDLGSLRDYGVHGDPKNKGLFPNGYSSLMKRFGAEADRSEVNKDALTQVTTVNSFFGDLKFKDIAKYVTREGGKYKMTPEGIQDFLNAPDSEFGSSEKAEYAKRMLAIHLQSKGGSHNDLSELINAGLVGGGCGADEASYKKWTDDPAYKELTFGQMASTKAETDRFSTMLGGLFEDSAKKQEFVERFATLDTTKQDEVTEKIEKVKEFEKKRQERVPYVNHLLNHRQELFTTSGQPPLQGIDPAKHGQLLTGLSEYATKHGALKLDFLKGSLTPPTFEEIVLDQFDDGVDAYVKSWLFDEGGGFDALKKYEDPAGTPEYDRKFAIDAMNNKWQLGNTTTGAGVSATKELLFKGNAESGNKDFFMSMSDDYKRSFWIKSDSGKFEEYVLDSIHDVKNFKLEGVGMHIDTSGKKTFKIKYPVSAGYPSQWSDFDPKFLAGIVDNLTKGVTDFKVSEERLDSGTTPHRFWDSSQKSIRKKPEFDPIGKLFGPSVVFTRTGNTRP